MNRDPEDTLAGLVGDTAVIALTFAIRLEQRLRNVRKRWRRWLGRDERF